MGSPRTVNRSYLPIVSDKIAHEWWKKIKANPRGEMDRGRKLFRLFEPRFSDHMDIVLDSYEEDLDVEERLKKIKRKGLVLDDALYVNSFRSVGGMLYLYSALMDQWEADIDNNYGIVMAILDDFWEEGLGAMKMPGSEQIGMDLMQKRNPDLVHKLTLVSTWVASPFLLTGAGMLYTGLSQYNKSTKPVAFLDRETTFS